MDALIDDEGPLWLLVSRTIWSLEELERLWVRIAGTDVASPPLWTDGEIGLDEKWYQLVEGALDFGAASIASATTLFFCMRRAQAIGSPYDYAMCYYGILGSVHRIVMEAESGPCVDPQCRFVDKSDIDCLILAEFWRQLGCFVEAWHSRIRVFSNCRDTFDLIAVGLAELIPDVVEASCLQGGNIVSERDFHPERCAWPVFSRQGELAFTVPRNPEAPRNWLYRPLPFPYPFRDTFP
ncbi:hypothetical protein [Paraburkholderia caribensis]|uniref:hypothetical protein n=1 Tax=Paraburkholderia caribensis TaxID=75105 RepID=UPI001591A622|nr:hypothetical protein [Paraburkholderia caribensis]